MINKKIKETIIQHALDCYPHESCGFITNNGYQACNNIAVNPCEDFMISIDEWQPSIAIVHSHPDGERFLSGSDRQQQVETGLPWFLVVDDQVIEYPCVPRLKGRDFNYGTADCCSLIVDAYRLADITLIDAIRSSIDADIENQAIIKCIKQNSFYQVGFESISVGDVVLTRYENDRNKASHASLYIGNEQILHHEINRLSRITSIAEFIANDDKNVHSVWRHEKWQDESITAVYNDINDL